MNRQKITTIVLCALFAAITAVLSQIAIPMPSGVPVTLQTFAIALCGFYLCTARATVSTVVYVLLGAVGVPVFNSRSYGRIYNRLYRYGCYQRNSIQKYARKIPCTA